MRLHILLPLVFFTLPAPAQAFWFLPSFGSTDLSSAREEAFGQPTASLAQPDVFPEIDEEPTLPSAQETSPENAIAVIGVEVESLGEGSSDEEFSNPDPTNPSNGTISLTEDEGNDDSIFISPELVTAPEGEDNEQIAAIPPTSNQPASQESIFDAEAFTMSIAEFDRILPSTAFDTTYDLSDGLTQPALATFPINVYLEVSPGDTLSSLFQEAGISQLETINAARSLGSVFNLGSLRPGQIIELELDGAVAPFEEDRLRRISIAPTNLEVIEVARTETGFESTLSTVELRRILVHAAGTLNTGSIYVDGASMNIEGSMIANFVNALDAQLNFSRIQSAGDEIEMIYEAYFNDDGVLVDAGNILYAAYRDEGGTDYEAFRFQHENRTSYYTRDARFTGQTNTLMRKPVGGGRLSSRYGYRIHPIYGTRRLHTGVDYAAGCGTPVYAAGNGVVSFAGWRGGYGRFISVRHGSTYSTNYAHLRSFATAIRAGTRVRKGQLIGRVGSTGASTGCHLHYEVVKNGNKINPLSDHIPRGDDLAAATRTRFRAYVGNLDQERNRAIDIETASTLASTL